MIVVDSFLKYLGIVLFLNLDQDIPDLGGGLAVRGGPVLGLEGVNLI